jgi:hypothetical protein
MTTESLSQRAEAIRQRMQAIRRDLPSGVEQTREEVSNLTDWKYYVRNYPHLILPLVTISAYSLVPQIRSQSSQVAVLESDKGVQRVRLVDDSTPKKSFLAGLASAALALAVRQGSAIAARQLLQVVQGSNNTTERGNGLA